MVFATNSPVQLRTNIANGIDHSFVHYDSLFEGMNNFDFSIYRISAPSCQFSSTRHSTYRRSQDVNPQYNDLGLNIIYDNSEKRRDSQALVRSIPCILGDLKYALLLLIIIKLDSLRRLKKEAYSVQNCRKGLNGVCQ